MANWIIIRELELDKTNAKLSVKFCDKQIKKFEAEGNFAEALVYMFERDKHYNNIMCYSEAIKNIESIMSMSLTESQKKSVDKLINNNT